MIDPKPMVAVALVFVWSSVIRAQQNPSPKVDRDRDKAIFLAVQQELRESHLDERKDVCVAFGMEVAAADEKEVLAALRSAGQKVHADKWCNNGPRGVTIGVGPLREIGASTYELVIDVDDAEPIRREGAHFATLLRRGTYTVRLSNGSVPALSYRQACCPEEKKESH